VPSRSAAAAARPGALGHPAVGDLGDAGPPQRRWHVCVLREQAGGVEHRLTDREVLEQPPGLHDRGNQAPPDGVLGCHAEDRDLAIAGGGKAENHVNGRGLARTVGAQECDDFSLANGQIDVAHCPDGAEILAEVTQTDRGRRFGIRPRI
jgi:hypothetical protein